MTMARRTANSRGFTLIELLIVIVVIAILALIIIPKLMGASRKSRDATLKANLQILRDSIAVYEADMGSYPANLTDLYDSSGTSPSSCWRGPYLKSEGSGAIGNTYIPINPYVSTSAISDHWTYTASTGSVIPATPAGLDAESKAYARY